MLPPLTVSGHTAEQVLSSVLGTSECSWPESLSVNEQMERKTTRALGLGGGYSRALGLGGGTQELAG